MIRLLSLGMVAMGWMGSGMPVAGQEKNATEKIVLDLGGGVKSDSRPRRSCDMLPKPNRRMLPLGPPS